MMGCSYSKQKKPTQRRTRQDKNDGEGAAAGAGTEQKENQNWNYSDTAIIELYDQETISVIKKDLNETPELFVLNNVLMCTLFLSNYQDEIQQALHKIEKEQDGLWEPDVIMEKANRNVVYRPMHGRKKNMAEPLVKRRIYVPMDEYVDVYSPLDNDDETNCNRSSKYRVKIEESKRQGYVKLQRLDTEVNVDGNSMKDVVSIPSSNTSGTSDTESTGTSVGMVIPENPQLIKDQTDECSLDDCFVYRKVKKPDIDLDIEEMDHENLTDEDIYDIVSYLPSRNFMKYFQSKIFKNSIAEQLGLDQYEVDNAIIDEHTPGKIFCNLRDENGNACPAEVLPCLKIKWPSKQTYEFLACKFSFKDGFILWPTNEMLTEMKHLECALVPKGYLRKRGIYPEGDLEWEIHFPLAESYLEATLRPAQIKSYLILLSLYKEYLEPITKSHGVIPEHFLTLILWESERDYHSWPEHRLGIKLLNIIKNFSNNLSQRSLRDYFIRKKNILKNVSRKYLEHANEVFHRIKQSPVTHIIRALRNIRYTSGNFYPPLNYKELLDILYKKEWEENPFLSNLSLDSYQNTDNISLSATSLGKKPKFIDAEKQLEYVKEKERKRKLMEKREKRNNIRNGGNLSYNISAETRRGSCDSIKDNWECEKRFNLQKKIALLKFFINNYIDIAQTSQKIGSNTQTMFYLKQAWYLAKILEDENKLFAEEVSELLVKIKKEEDKIIDAVHSNISIPEDFNILKEIEIEASKLEELPELDDIFEAAFASEFRSSEQINTDGDNRHQINQINTHLGSLCRSFSVTVSQTEFIQNCR